MATVTFTINDALIPRIAAAYGVPNGQIKAAIVAQVKGVVLDYEQRMAFIAAQTAIDDAIASQLSSSQAAKTTADAQVVIT